ncbi:MAG: hypothetical protein ABI628_01715 [Chloroflexota bacterium]
MGSLDALGSADALGSGVAGVAGASDVAVGFEDGDSVGVGLERAIGTTKIEPPVLEALDSTTAACSACGSSTTDPGLLEKDSTRFAPASIEAQSEDGAASWGQTEATLAMFMV